MLDPKVVILPPKDDLLNELESEFKAACQEVVYLEDFYDDFDFNSIAPAVVISSEPTIFLDFLSTFHKEMKQSLSKSILVSHKGLPDSVLKPMRENGLSDYLEGDVDFKRLEAKVCGHIESIQIEMEEKTQVD